MGMKFFLHILKRNLNEKYPNVDFEVYILHQAKNVHMGLDQNILFIQNYEEIKKYWRILTRYEN